MYPTGSSFSWNEYSGSGITELLASSKPYIDLASDLDTEAALCLPVDVDCQYVENVILEII